MQSVTLNIETDKDDISEKWCEFRYPGTPNDFLARLQEDRDVFYLTTDPDDFTYPNQRVPIEDTTNEGVVHQVNYYTDSRFPDDPYQAGVSDEYCIHAMLFELRRRNNGTHVKASCFLNRAEKDFIEILNLFDVALLEPPNSSQLKDKVQEAEVSISNEPALTDREKEVAERLAEGLNDEEIAKELVIASSTVRKHRQNIADKWKTGQGLKLMQQQAQQRGYMMVGKDTLNSTL